MGPAATPRSHIGTGSAFVAEARNAGMSVDIALTAAIVTSYLGDPLAHGAGALPAAEAACFVAGFSGPPTA
jgi:hypothetical protein